MAREREPNLVTSGLSQVVVKGGFKLEVCIVRLEHENDWSLEVVTPDGASTVWQDRFATDQAAYDEFERTVREEGVKAFLGPDNVIPFRR